ncbi:MAG: HEPN domain-containing protein [Theionarchaea archaeon]|nr:HEPN domain-containing protein [Theionarchaea archaeon]
MSKIDNFLDAASEKFVAAEVLAKQEYFADAITRTCYGLLFCARALLLTKNITVEAPDDVISHFDKEFVKKGIVDKEMGTLLKDVWKLTKKADFSPAFGTSDEKIRSLMEKAELFMEQTEDAIGELEE